MVGTVDVAARVRVYWASAKKIEGETKRMHVSLGFEPYLLSNSEAEWREVVPKTQVLNRAAGTIDVFVRT